jgi:hypothetical protein
MSDRVFASPPLPPFSQTTVLGYERNSHPIDSTLSLPGWAAEKVKNVQEANAATDEAFASAMSHHAEMLRGGKDLSKEQRESLQAMLEFQEGLMALQTSLLGLQPIGALGNRPSRAKALPQKLR